MIRAGWKVLVILVFSGLLLPSANQCQGVRGELVLHGIDISRWAGVPRVDTWQQIYNDGWTCVVVGAWGSYGTNPYARDQLAGANQAGLKTAAYCLLHWDRTSYGGWQVQQALDAVGDQIANLSFVAIDVETGGGPIDPAVDPVARIAAARDAILDAGLVPVIYTNRSSWDTITHGSTVFSDLPLWFARYDGRDELNTDGSGTWQPLAGWTSQSGKQYRPNVNLHGVNTDSNVFDPSLFP